MKSGNFKFVLIPTLLLAIQLIILPAFSQAPDSFLYQAVIRAENGEILANQSVGIQIQILQGSESGSIIFAETHQALTDENGLIRIEIGGGTPVQGTINDINRAAGPCFLNTQIDPTGGDNYSIYGVGRILSVPYAWYAKTAEHYTGTITETDPVFRQSPARSITDFDTAYWNILPDSTFENDQVFYLSVAKGISENDIRKWNNKPDTETQTLADVLMIDPRGFRQIKNIGRPTGPQDAATKAYADSLAEPINILMRSFKSGGPVRDFDGNLYNTVQIGNQVWMAENMKTTRYADGTPVPDGTGIGSIAGNYTSKYWFVYDDSLKYKKEYGLLYTWTAAMNGSPGSAQNPSGVQGVCPTGWHVPSHPEWQELVEYLGGIEVAGGKLKETGTAHWNSPNTGATNSSFFSAVATGVRSPNGSYWNILNTVWFISTTELPDSYYHVRPLGWERATAEDHYAGSKDQGQAVRCLKD
jgi:uncharacterized protein (TIGR02145 family)